jgi:cyclic pyranopterin phosphate synthase
MPPDFADWMPSDHLLSVDELVFLVSVAVEHGISQVRLTGGEPLLRPDIADIISRIRKLPDAPRVSLTTNGIRLGELAPQLKAAGLERVNVSLDTLSREKFAELTYRDRFLDVLAGISAAQAAGLHPVKVNAVLMRGINDHEAIPLLERAIDEGWSLRFIEQMPLDAGGSWEKSQMVSAAETLAVLSERFNLVPVEGRGSAPAEEFSIEGTDATVGIIASVSDPFCSACDRLRLTADGQLRNCLFSADETDLRHVLRRDDLDEQGRREGVGRLFASSTMAKLQGHGIGEPTFVQPSRPMSAIGG